MAQTQRKLKKIPTRRSFLKEPLIRTQLSTKLMWMHPFLLKAKKKMPSLDLPKQVRPFRPGKKRIMRVFGNIYFQKKVVSIATHTQVTYVNSKGQLKIKRIIRLPKARMLDTLAHELAHLRYPDHNYEHEEYTRIIFKTFDLKERCPTCKGTGKIELECKP